MRRRFATFRVVVALILREMSTTYGRSPGGYIWAILEPIGAIAILSFVFVYLFRLPPLGTNFALFMASGFLPLGLYTGLTSKVGMSIPFSRPLLTYPAVHYIDAIAARVILHVITQIVVMFIILGGLIVYYDLNVTLNLWRIADAIMMAVALGTGIGLLNCYLMAMYPIWATVWAVLNRPMFIISGVFFLIDTVPQAYRDILLYNPVAHIIMQLRSGIYVTYDAVYVSDIYVYLCALIPGLFGLLLLHRYHNDLLEV
ncbi:sugar ABC transporter permease [Tateyamaria sp. ANG-S1]|nr:sugar ABC transporter permease [Tateyamaria sp. ANG-S1]